MCLTVSDVQRVAFRQPDCVSRMNARALERGEVDQDWFDDRARVLTETYSDDARDQRLHLTSDYTLMGPVRYHLYRQVRRRAQAMPACQSCACTT